MWTNIFRQYKTRLRALFFPYGCSTYWALRGILLKWKMKEGRRTNKRKGKDNSTKRINKGNNVASNLTLYFWLKWFHNQRRYEQGRQFGIGAEHWSPRFFKVSLCHVNIKEGCVNIPMSQLPSYRGAPLLKNGCYYMFWLDFTGSSW